MGQKTVERKITRKGRTKRKLEITPIDDLPGGVSKVAFGQELGFSRPIGDVWTKGSVFVYIQRSCKSEDEMDTLQRTIADARRVAIEELEMTKALCEEEKP